MQFYRLLILILLINPSYLFGQDGFIDTFRYHDSLPVWNENMVYNSISNTIILTGLTREPELFNQGIYLREIDTLGIFLRDTLIIDPSGKFHLAYDFYPTLLTSDNNLLILGSTTDSIFMHMYIIDSDFNLVAKIFFPHDPQTIKTTLYTNIFEVSDGYILHLAKQHINFNIKQHLLKIDKEGQVMWEKEYGENSTLYSSLSQSTLSNNIIYISGAKSKNGISKYLFEIDLEGNLLNEFSFEKEDDLKVVNLGPIVIDSQGNIIAESSIITLWDNNNGPKSKILEISKYSPEYSLIWKKQFGIDLQWALSGVQTLSIVEEDNILASGNIVSIDSASNPSLLLKLSSEGEVIWQRRDTIFQSEMDKSSSFSKHTTEKHIVLPSGSIVMAGTTKQSDDIGGEIYGYVIKVDKDGCLEQGCREGVNVNSILINDSYEIFPNPSNGKFKIKGSYKDVQLCDAFGKEILVTSFSNENETVVEVSSFSDGVYYFTITSNGVSETKKIILINN